MDDRALAALLCDELAAQDGVVTWHQLVEHGARQHDRERWVRRRLLVPVHRAVYVAHTGPLTDTQRLWAAVLACGPGAALCLIGRPGPLVHVAIDASRRVAAPTGVRLHRVRGLEAQVRWSASPPRLLPEHDVLLGVGLAVDEEEVVRLLSDAVRTRVTTAARLREVVGARTRLRHRRLVLAVLDDVERGTHSVLEHRYLRDVERAHGLPTGAWQQRRSVDGRTEYADVPTSRTGSVSSSTGGPATRAGTRRTGTPGATWTRPPRAGPQCGCATARSSGRRAPPPYGSGGCCRRAAGRRRSRGRAGRGVPLPRSAGSARLLVSTTRPADGGVCLHRGVLHVPGACSTPRCAARPRGPAHGSPARNAECRTCLVRAALHGARLKVWWPAALAPRPAVRAPR